MPDNHDQEENDVTTYSPETDSTDAGMSNRGSSGTGIIIAILLIIACLFINALLSSYRLIPVSSMSSVWFVEFLAPLLISIFFFIKGKRSTALGIIGTFVVPILFLLLIGLLLFGSCLIIMGIGGGFHR